MHAPDDAGAGAAGNTGTAGQAGTTGRGGASGTATAGTAGAPTGIAGTGGGAAGTGASCALSADAGASGGACGATFDFENDVEGATIKPGSSAFQSVAKSNAFTFCGSGALAITAMFSGTSGPTTKGEVLIDLPGAPADLTGKTITVHVAADPGCNSDLYLAVVLNTQSGAIYLGPDFPIRPVTNMWKTGAAAVPAVAGSTSVLQISLQAISQTGYQGTIYIDEIGIK